MDFVVSYMKGSDFQNSSLQPYMIEFMPSVSAWLIWKIIELILLHHSD